MRRKQVAIFLAMGIVLSAATASAAEEWLSYNTIDTITAEATYIEVRMANYNGSCGGIFNLYKTHANYQSLSTLLFSAFHGGHDVSLKIDNNADCAEPITKVRVAF